MFDVILDLHCIFIQSLCTAVFLSSLFEFLLLHKDRWYAFLQRHCSISDDVALKTGLTGVPDNHTSPTEPGQFQMSEIATIGTIGAYIRNNGVSPTYRIHSDACTCTHKYIC